MAYITGMGLLILICVGHYYKLNWKPLGFLFVLNNSLIIYTLSESVYLSFAHFILSTVLLMMVHSKFKRWVHPKEKICGAIYLFISFGLLALWTFMLKEESLFLLGGHKFKDQQIFQNLIQNYAEIFMIFFILFIFAVAKINFHKEAKS